MNAMDDANPQPTAPPKSRRRWFRFGLRTMMIAVTLFCVWLGITANRANRQRRAVETIKSHGGYVRYDYEADDNGGLPVHGPTPPPGPEWLRSLIGVDYFASVVQVEIDSGNGAVDDSITVLANFPRLRSLCLKGAGVTDSVMAKIGKLTELHVLQLWQSSVTDAGCENLEKLTQLELLELSKDHFITDASLAHIQSLSRLEFLWLSGSSGITDAALQHLKNLTNLKSLNPNKTQITVGGVEQLKRVLPRLQYYPP